MRNMKTSKRNDEFGELVSKVSELSKKDYRDLWRITRQYRKANQTMEQSLIRQKREAMPAKSKAIDKTALGMNYELA